VHEVFSDKKIDGFKRDWKQFTELRRSVQIRYQEVVDIKEYEPKVQKLLDDHVIALPAETIIKAVNINDPKALQAVVAESGITAASKADRIASATKRTITENMEADPAFYLRFSEMLEETIRDYRQHRMSEKEYLNSIIEIAGKVAGKDRGRELPTRINGNDDAAAFFGVLEPALNGADDAEQKDQVAEIALALIDIVKAHHIVDVWSNEVAKNRMRDAIDDYFFDVVRDQKGINLPVETLDDLESRIMNVASVRFPG
jgi:type I restriction enzyme R subunit